MDEDAAGVGDEVAHQRMVALVQTGDIVVSKCVYFRRPFPRVRLASGGHFMFYLQVIYKLFGRLCAEGYSSITLFFVKTPRYHARAAFNGRIIDSI